MKAAGIISLLLLLSVSSAAILESGDNGAQFVNDTALEKCGEGGVDAVYVCLANVVKAVSAGENTFYKPEGKVVHCANVSPSEMGAECVQLLMPNYCTVEFQCPAPTEPPPANDTVVEDVQNASGPVATAQPQKPAKDDQGGTVGVRLPGYNGESESLLGYLATVVLGLGVAAVSILFVLFKKSIAEDEA